MSASVTLEISPSMTMQGGTSRRCVARPWQETERASEVLETIRPIVVRYCRARATVERSGLLSR